MSDNPRVPLEKGLKVGNEVLQKLSPFCKKIEIVGSIRRERHEVGDVEVLCIPKTQEVPDGFFCTKTIPVDGFVLYINSMKKIRGDPATGKAFARIHESGIQIDIFTATDKTWGVQKVIRTGPWQYSKLMVTDIKSRGFRVADGGNLQRWVENSGFQNVPCYTEKDFYDITGQPFIIPLARV